MSSHNAITFRWLRTGDDVFPAMLAAIDAAQKNIRLEIYNFADSALGTRFRDALVRARQQGVEVKVMVDSFGSITLSGNFWDQLIASGGQFHWFNPMSLKRFGIRDHRKMLVCDEQIAFIGGFNIASEYEGNGVTKGWHDLGLQVTGPLVRELAAAFDDQFSRADFRHRWFVRLRKSSATKLISARDGELLLSGPGRGRNPIKRILRRDLVNAQDVKIIQAYFLPTWRIRRELMRVARRGGRVQLILAGKSDVPLLQLATHSLYQRLLRASVEIYEYQPQILHAKLIIVDEVVYAGSANLDTRSLHINYELLVRLQDRKLAAEAREIFSHDLKHCQRVEQTVWRKSRTFWNKLKERWAYFLFVRVDTYIARRQFKTLRH
jgi:cardiolipin synthase A/B